MHIAVLLGFIVSLLLSTMYFITRPRLKSRSLKTDHDKIVNMIASFMGGLSHTSTICFAYLLYSGV